MYDLDFYAEEGRVAYVAATHVLPVILGETGARSVIDVGCGTGAWVYVAHHLGLLAVGVDYGVPVEVRTTNLYIDHDLSNGYDCTGWDLAVCLEVAEHLEPSAAEPLVEGLAAAQAVLFSAATPGQPGVNHINCQPHGYWHDLFAWYEFTPAHRGPEFPGIADFYQRNLFLYTRGAAA